MDRRLDVICDVWSRTRAIVVGSASRLVCAALSKTIADMSHTPESTASTSQSRLR